MKQQKPVLCMDQQKKQRTERIQRRKEIKQGEDDQIFLLPRIIHEAPDDILDMVMSKIKFRLIVDLNEPNGYQGSKNPFRLACKRLKRAVDSCVSHLTWDKSHMG